LLLYIKIFAIKKRSLLLIYYLEHTSLVLKICCRGPTKIMVSF